MAAERSGLRTALWWALNRDRVFAAAGLVVAAGLVLLLAALLGWPRRGEIVVGRVVGFGLHETEQGSDLVAVVQLRGVQTSVLLGRSHNCRVGDAIAMRKQILGLVPTYPEPCTHPNAAS